MEQDRNQPLAIRLMRAGLRRFRREDGAVTVEAVLWVPFFVFCLTMVADGALIFFGQARALQVAQDANRAYSVGTLKTPQEVKTFIETSLQGMSPHASAQTVSNDGILTTVISLPASDLAAIGFFTSLTSFNMQVVAQMVQEF